MLDRTKERTMKPMPPHLARLGWYAQHQAWRIAVGWYSRHDPGNAEPVRARLADHDLNGIDLRDADLRSCDWSGADLSLANIDGATFRNATPRCIVPAGVPQ
jgi:hypothetical protein